MKNSLLLFAIIFLLSIGDTVYAGNTLEIENFKSAFSTLEKMALVLKKEPLNKTISTTYYLHDVNRGVIASIWKPDNLTLAPMETTDSIDFVAPYETGKYFYSVKLMDGETLIGEYETRTFRVVKSKIKPKIKNLEAEFEVVPEATGPAVPQEYWVRVQTGVSPHTENTYVAGRIKCSKTITLYLGSMEILCSKKWSQKMYESASFFETQFAVQKEDLAQDIKLQIEYITGLRLQGKEKKTDKKSISVTLSDNL